MKMELTALFLAISLCACSATVTAQPESEPQRDYSKAEVVVEYGILGAELIHSVPTSMTASGTGDILVEPGTEIGGVVLTEAYLEEYDFSVSGPQDSNPLELDGITACHNTAFAVLYGEVVEVDRETAVNPESAQLTIYTIPSSVGIPTFCRSLSGEILTFADPNAFEVALETDPEQFL